MTRPHTLTRLHANEPPSLVRRHSRRRFSRLSLYRGPRSTSFQQSIPTYKFSSFFGPLFWEEAQVARIGVSVNGLSTGNVISLTGSSVDIAPADHFTATAGGVIISRPLGATLSRRNAVALGLPPAKGS